MFKIGDFSKLAQVSVKTLRYYGELGLLKPAWIDRFTGYRYYSAEQLPRLNRILALKELGFSLEQIRRLARDDLPASELRGMMRMKWAELERQVQAEQARLKRVEARLRQIEQEGALPAYEVVLKSVPPQKVIGIRRVIPGFNHVPALLEELCGDLQARGMSINGTYPFLAIFFDIEFHERGVDVEAAMPCSGLSSKLLQPGVHELEGVDSMACAVHNGAYERLGEAYNAMMTWIELNGYRVAGPNRDVYLQAPQAGSGAAGCIAEVQFPVQRKATPYIISKNQENKKMETKIVSKPAFTAVGMQYYGKNENKEISSLWDEFLPRIQELKHITDGAFGLCLPAESDGNFKYLASLAVSTTQDNVPSGMLTWDIPAQTYAVFPCTLKTIRETYRYAFETWLPGSEYEYTRGPDFEFYDESFNPQDPEKSVMYIYIPVKKLK